MYEIRTQSPADLAEIESLLDVAFGPNRQAKTSYRYRDSIMPIPDLGMVARENGQLLGTIRYWPVSIGKDGMPALLLGPLAVRPERQGQGIARALIRLSLERAQAAGHRLVVLVGDPAYYLERGFELAEARGLFMPDEAGRLLARGLVPGAFNGVRGAIWRADGRPAVNAV